MLRIPVMHPALVDRPRHLRAFCAFAFRVPTQAHALCDCNSWEMKAPMACIVCKCEEMMLNNPNMACKSERCCCDPDFKAPRMRRAGSQDDEEAEDDETAGNDDEEDSGEEDDGDTGGLSPSARRVPSPGISTGSRRPPSNSFSRPPSTSMQHAPAGESIRRPPSNSMQRPVDNNASPRRPPSNSMQRSGEVDNKTSPRRPPAT